MTSPRPLKPGAIPAMDETAIRPTARQRRPAIIQARCRDVARDLRRRAVGALSGRAFRRRRREIGWRMAILREPRDIRVAIDQGGVVRGFGSCGPSRGERNFPGEVFTLYVAPDWQNQGVGRRLLIALFRRLVGVELASGIVWVLRDNPARFFTSGSGGRLVSSHKPIPVGGTEVEALAYGWPDLPTYLAAVSEDRGPRRDEPRAAAAPAAFPFDRPWPDRIHDRARARHRAERRARNRRRRSLLDEFAARPVQSSTETAIAQANRLRLPVLVGFGLTEAYPEANARHYAILRRSRRNHAGPARPRPRRRGEGGPSRPGGARPCPACGARRLRPRLSRRRCGIVRRVPPRARPARIAGRGRRRRRRGCMVSAKAEVARLAAEAAAATRRISAAARLPTGARAGLAARHRRRSRPS